MNRAVRVILAVDESGGIGSQGSIPWFYPKDLSRFRRLTMGGTLIMGRKTWESIGYVPLPGRSAVVVSRTLSSAPGAEVERDLDSSLARSGNLWVIGGAALAEEASKRFADEVLLTHVPGTYPCDVRVDMKSMLQGYEVSATRKEGDLTYVRYVRRTSR